MAEAYAKPWIDSLTPHPVYDAKMHSYIITKTYYGARLPLALEALNKVISIKKRSCDGDIYINNCLVKISGVGILKSDDWPSAL